MKKQKKQETTEAFLEINVTPLADVALVLVIILMLLMPAAIQSMIRVKSQALGPKTVSGQKAQTAVSIRITSRGIFLESVRMTSDQELASRLNKIFLDGADRQALVKAERKISHGDVVRVLDIIRQNGGEKISMIRSQT